MLPIGIPMIAVVSGFPALVAQLHLAHPFKFDLAQATIYHQDPWNPNSQLEVDCFTLADGTITCDTSPGGHPWVKTYGVGRWSDNQKPDAEQN